MSVLEINYNELLVDRDGNPLPFERRKVPVNLLKLDLTVYPRAGLMPDLIDCYYRIVIEKGVETFPPIITSHDFTIIDGAHRYKAFTSLDNVDELEVEIVRILSHLSVPEMLILAVKLNTLHGQNLTNRDLQYIRNMINQSEESANIWKKRTDKDEIIALIDRYIKYRSFYKVFQNDSFVNRVVSYLPSTSMQQEVQDTDTQNAVASFESSSSEEKELVVEPATDDDLADSADIVESSETALVPVVVETNVVPVDNQQCVIRPVSPNLVSRRGRKRADDIRKSDVKMSEDDFQYRLTPFFADLVHKNVLPAHITRFLRKLTEAEQEEITREKSYIKKLVDIGADAVDAIIHRLIKFTSEERGRNPKLILAIIDDVIDSDSYKNKRQVSSGLLDDLPAPFRKYASSEDEARAVILVYKSLHKALQQWDQIFGGLRSQLQIVCYDFIMSKIMLRYLQTVKSVNHNEYAELKRELGRAFMKPWNDVSAMFMREVFLGDN